ncbi:MAG TPA: hypothetical protein VJW94_17790 [Candidatus Acidoferrum sp.]|nr:hypothetical protein [Candidatus Acidoferrum sp.]
MKNYLIAALLCITALFASPARPQTPTTNLVMIAHWDDGTNIQGTVTLGQQNASGPDTVIVSQTLSNGAANVSETLGAATMYDVTLVTTAGTQLLKFPITTAMINPGNLQQAEIKLIFSKANSSLKSVKITVAMGF